jgi:hypothetical protein
MHGEGINTPLNMEWYEFENTELKVPCSPSYAYHRLGWIKIVLCIGLNIDLRSTGAILRGQ